MKRTILTLILGSALATSANAATIFGVDENNRLVSFDSANPGTFTSDVQITGTTATVLALDVRDSDRMLYALGGDLRVYTLDAVSGLATAVTGVLDLQGTSFGFDFNTVVDAIRVVSNTDANYVVRPENNSATRFDDVAYGAGDPNAALDPVVTANAYIHGTPDQFAIDVANSILVRQANNAGTLTTVGPLGVAVGPRTSFDIGFDGTAYAADVSRFYTVNLGTGTATFVGNTQRAVFGITATPFGAVPEPSTWAMMLLGFGAIGFAMRRSKVVRTSVSYA